MKIDHERDGAGFWTVVRRGKVIQRAGPFPTDQRRKEWERLNIDRGQADVDDGNQGQDSDGIDTALPNDTNRSVRRNIRRKD